MKAMLTGKYLEIIPESREEYRRLSEWCELYNTVDEGIHISSVEPPEAASGANEEE